MARIKRDQYIRKRGLPINTTRRAVDVPVPGHDMQSSLHPSLRPSPRSRYNSNFVTKLLKELETDSEADLTQLLSKYSSERVNKLRGTSTNIQPIAVDPEQKDTQPRIPEPYGSFSIVSSLAPQVKTLIGFDSTDTSNGSLNSLSTFWHMLKHGEVLYQVLSKWIVRIAPSIVVKFAPGLDISEHQTMCHVWSHSHMENIPMPEPLGAISIGNSNYIFMTFIEGASLGNIWSHLSPELKSSVRSQLGEILQFLRKVPLQSNCLGSGDPPLCRDLRRFVRTSSGSISTEMEFNTFLSSTHRELNPVFVDLCTSKLSTSHRIVMTHSDIRPENILVLYTAPSTIRISGLVDWELSGAYPEYWEYVKALAGVNSSSSDWYSYLPLNDIGNHAEAWHQDCFISRLVL